MDITVETGTEQLRRDPERLRKLVADQDLVIDVTGIMGSLDELAALAALEEMTMVTCDALPNRGTSRASSAKRPETPSWPSATTPGVTRRFPTIRPTRMCSSRPDARRR